MKTYLDYWIQSAKVLFSQALAGEPHLLETEEDASDPAGRAYRIEIVGSVTGNLQITLDPDMLSAPLLGEGVDQRAAWAEFLREVAEAAAGEMLSASGYSCRIEACYPTEAGSTNITRTFRLQSAETSWLIGIEDELRQDADIREATEEVKSGKESGSGLDLLLDVELEAALRFGCCEMALGEILELGPGDVVELDRHTSDPVDLVVGDKIVARGEVVLVNGNFGLRVMEVSTPQSRLESIRCLF